jgi:hypothetical protein
VRLVKYAICTPDGSNWFTYCDTMDEALDELMAMRKRGCALVGSIYKRVFIDTYANRVSHGLVEVPFPGALRYYSGRRAPTYQKRVTCTRREWVGHHMFENKCVCTIG